MLALSLAVVALLASTAFAVSSWVVGEAVEPPVTRSEYRRAQEVLRLPPGDAWPDASVGEGTVTSRGAGGGRAVLIALNAWECYWVDAIRVRDADAQRRARAALGALLQRHVVEAPSGAPEGWAPPDASTRPVAVFAADGGLAWIREGYALAAAGDPRRIAASCRANAPG